jgi:hypothetical protein
MGNGGGLLFIGALCWLALGAYLTGALLRRAEVTRAVGESVNTLAFLLYVLGAGATAVILISYVNDSNLPMVATLYGAVVGIPLLVCSIQFYRNASKRKRDY